MTGSRRGTVLVTGATGAAGPAVVRAAVAAGYAVRTLSRCAPGAGVLPPDVDVRTGDIRDCRLLERALEGVDRVLHLAALLHVIAPQRCDPMAFEEVNAAATRTLARVAAAAGVTRVVLFSTIAVYGDSHDVLASEDTPPAPDTAYARSKLDAERAVLEPRAPDGGALGVVLRLAAVYGPRVRGNYRQLVRQLARGRFIPIGEGRNRRTLVFDDDVARAALLAVDHPDARGAVFNVTDGRHHEVREIISAICAALDRPPPRVAVPISLARAAATACDGALGLVGRTPRFVNAVGKYTHEAAIDGTRIQRVLGFRPAVSLENGWKATVHAMRAAGEI